MFVIFTCCLFLLFISLACELHLGSVPLSDSFDSVVDAFLTNTTTSSSGEGADAAATIVSTSVVRGKRLFVWTNNNDNDDSQSTILQAALDRLPKQTTNNNKATSVVVFCHNCQGEITHSSQLQCLTFLHEPPMMEGATETVQGDDNDGGTLPSSSSSSSAAAILQAMQLYTASFLPTLQSLSTIDEDNANLLQDKIRQLDVALQQTSRLARLPHVQLPIHSVIAKAIETAGDTGKLDLESLGLTSYVNDDDFLNTLQTGVSQWIVQIRTITVLPKTTPFVETMAEEVAFWTQLQSELQNIQQQLKSPGVEVTLSLLREAKRFVATLALENNTGLEQAVAYTTDVANFIKPLPLQDLQAANDFDKIAAAMNAVFDHLPKIRQSRYYSLERSAQLVQAMTAVVRDSLLTVLEHQHSNFLFMDYKEYEEKVRFPVLDVFVQFDDRFDEWKDFFLEQGRRRKLTGLNKVVEKLVLEHALLKDRLEQIHDFRSSQERLRQVVHTVLREEEPAAIQQVEQAPRQIFGSLQVLDLSPGGSKALESALEEYDLQMDALEERLAKLLRDKLTECQVRFTQHLFAPSSFHYANVP